jgi:exodeoxyribonuclease VII large subunit
LYNYVLELPKVIFMQEPRSVSEITRQIKSLLESDSRLQDVWIAGEISNFTQASSGHLYFSLKDGGAQIRCAMWRSSAVRLTSLPRSGDSVVAHGYVGVYESRGDYQFYADALRPAGVGDLYRQFEELKRKLEAEGLFDAARKRPLPAFPRRLGVVTSADAAAFQDVQNVLRRRYPLVEVLLASTLVQGIDAPTQIVRALARLNARPDIDAILVCRGGGSIEDLWAFNDEGVARAIAASRIPVISGVGHETDFTIADFVADVRAPTPSAAAEMLTPDAADLRQNLDRMSSRLADAVGFALDSRRRAVGERAWALKQVSPAVKIRAHKQNLLNFDRAMLSRERGRIALARERLNSLGIALVAASPQAILQRGYALISANGRRVTAVTELEAGMTITLEMRDGTRRAQVEQDDNGSRTGETR